MTNKPTAFTHFRVTKTLAAYLDTVPKSHGRKLAHIQSLIIFLQTVSKRGKDRFVNVSSKHLNSICGHYRGIVEELTRLGELEVNERYSKEQRFTKSYRVERLSSTST